MSFALDLKAFADKTSARTQQIVRKIVIDVGTAMVMKSPVGDPLGWKNPSAAPAGYVGGRFRANWQYGYNTIDRATTTKVDASGQTSISAIVGGVSGKDAAAVHYITNSLPYAQRIEEGHSQRQAPQGVVRLTVMEFQPIVEAAARALQ